MKLEQKNGVALITGVSSGIGATYADRLARRGYDLILVARNKTRLKALAARLTSETGRSVKVLRADLSNKAELVKVEATLRDDPRITVLVNSAGIAFVATMLARRSQFHQSVLGAHISVYDQASAATLRGITGKLIAAGVPAGEALPRAQALIYATVQKQSALLAFLDVFWLLCLLALASVPLVLLVKNIRRGAPRHLTAVRQFRAGPSIRNWSKNSQEITTLGEIYGHG